MLTQRLKVIMERRTSLWISQGIIKSGSYACGNSIMSVLIKTDLFSLLLGRVDKVPV